MSLRGKSAKGSQREVAVAYIVFWLSVLFIILLVALALIPSDPVDRTPQDPDLPVEQGDLSQVIAEIVEAAPRRGSEKYVEPSLRQLAEFASLASSMETGDLVGASQYAEALGYTLVRFDDSSTGQRMLVAREEAEYAHEPERGWGTIVVDPEGANILIEVPHPIYERGTSEVGVGLFRETGAKALLVAGAHRYSWEDERSDVAHASNTAFNAAHEALLPASFVVQPHGFDSEEKYYYPDVILSSGAVPASARAKAIYRGLEEAGLSVGLYDRDSRFENVGGTTNAQGVSTRQAGGEFVHVEAARGVRADVAERSRLVKAIASSLTRSDSSRNG